MLGKLSIIARNRSTYRIGLLQDKAYRVMKREVNAMLAPHKVSTTEWAFLGLLFDKVVEYPSSAAEELGVEAPFVTSMVRHLSTRGFVQEEMSVDDNRRKRITITEAGKEFVSATEREIRGPLRTLVKGASAGALVEYLTVLEHVIKNAHKK